MSTDGVRFAHCVSEGSSLRLRGEESGQRLEPLLTRGREAKAGAFAYPGEESRAKAGAFAYAGRERQRLEPSLTRGEREAKAGAFAYDGCVVLNPLFSDAFSSPATSHQPLNKVIPDNQECEVCG